MKRTIKYLHKDQTKPGVASLYVVIFATILFGVITLSFVRIILSETSQTSNDDLSQSAFDSALAGVEDAKTAIKKCLSENNGNMNACAGLFGGSCQEFKLREYLYPGLTEEVKVQETNSNGTDQAYTCVIMNKVLADYRVTLGAESRTRVVPIGINDGDLDDLKTITVSWYSNENAASFENLDHAQGKFQPKDNSTIPPTVSVSLIKTGAEIKPSDYNNSTGADYSTMVFLPVEDTAPDSEVLTDNTIKQAEINNAANADKTHNPYQVKCKDDSDFACSVTLDDLAFTSGGNAFLVLHLPYGDANTDFKVNLLDESGNDLEFEGAQISIDSTGRANELYRRVETRLDPSDEAFPYPEYELTLGGDGDDDPFKKNFWITRNCWTENGECKNGETVINNGDL